MNSSAAYNKNVIDGTMSGLPIPTLLFNEPSSDGKVKLFEKINLVIYESLTRPVRFLARHPTFIMHDINSVLTKYFFKLFLLQAVYCSSD